MMKTHMTQKAASEANVLSARWSEPVGKVVDEIVRMVQESLLCNRHFRARDGGSRAAVFGSTAAIANDQGRAD